MATLPNLPDFEVHGYQVLETLNHNSLAGRITYKAIELGTQIPVVIKQFRFATTRDWEAYKQVEWEINILQGLNHLGIPRYIDTFDPGDGFCLVQEYKNAPNLSVSRSFSPEEIKDIAIQLLGMLIYLQNRVPTIIHRDIKPENILFYEQLKKVYLVDFGFARIGGGQITALSSMIMETTGFMPPEQMLNRPLTEASDLYGLGAIIICLLTGKRSIELSDLVNHDFRINYKTLVTKYSLQFINWLDLMVEPDVKKRFANAEIALKALQPLDIIRVPEIKLERLELQFTASHIGEKLSQTITVSNESPDTILEGRWSVSPNKNDPPHTPDSHLWIHFSPKEFKGNQVRCNITVDTSKLKADNNYDREIVLESNARQEKYYLKVKVETAPSYLFLAASFCIIAVLSGVLLQGWMAVNNESLVEIIVWMIRGATIGMIVGAISGAIAGGINRGISLAIVVAIYGAIIGIISGAGGVAIGLVFDVLLGETYGFFSMMGGCVGVCGAVFISVSLGNKYRDQEYSYRYQNFRKQESRRYILITTVVGILTGIGAIIGFNPYILGVLGVTGLPLTGMLIYPLIRQQRLKAQYHRQESQNLIEP